jgi:hypothetical protein
MRTTVEEGRQCGKDSVTKWSVEGMKSYQIARG